MRSNRITIPGFYDKVEELSTAERADFKNIPFSLENYQDALDIESVYGEEGFSTLERKSIRPTLDVNGIWGGYTGEGAKQSSHQRPMPKSLCDWYQIRSRKKSPNCLWITLRLSLPKG